jgi:pimeloyl-ACP methyl ester carboxylesterase
MPSALAHDGSVIDVRVHGSGPAVLMHPVYSYPGAPPEVGTAIAALEGALAESLADRYRLIMFDYPGGPWPDTMTAGTVVADLTAIADAAGADRYAWCGYSWTAVIGLQLALDNPRMSGLVCGGWPPMHAPYQEVLQRIEDGLAGEGVFSALPPPMLHQFATFYRSLQAYDDVRAQERITCPRLCFAGGADDVAGAGIGRRVIDHRERLEGFGWDVRIVDGLGHEELLRPDVLIPLIAGWLDEHREVIQSG